jgi:hypothetical protein
MFCVTNFWQNFKLCQIIIPAIQQAKAKVKLMQKKLVIIKRMIRLKMPRNAQRELPVLRFSGRGEFCSTDSGFDNENSGISVSLDENCIVFDIFNFFFNFKLCNT